jgi:hypothetical protein|tara:strand:+ start:611 stop:817 length:207 start_codon:yes stop_codon:yes gene_type:complete
MNFNAGVGFFIALIITKYNPVLISFEWYLFAMGLVLFTIPGLISTYAQLKVGSSLKSIKLDRRPFRTF